jgi:hypothetical protein
VIRGFLNEMGIERRGVRIWIERIEDKSGWKQERGE